MHRIEPYWLYSVLFQVITTNVLTNKNMKKYTLYLTGVLLFVNTIAIFAQNHYNIRLSPNEVSPLGKLCYELQLASADGVELNLAGQNYRLYYDANQLNYDEGASQNLLPKEKYTDLRIKDNLQNMDARGAGPFGFDGHLSFLNLGNDLKDEEIGGITLPADGNWVSTANVCFQINNQAETAKDYGLYWARPELTKSYATAYVEIAEWVSPGQTKPAKASIYFDQELSTSLNKEIENQSLLVYPNPTKDKVFIEYDGPEVFELQVYSAIGQLVLEDKFSANSANYGINLEGLSAGVYQLRLSTDKKQLVKRIEKID